MSGEGSPSDERRTTQPGPLFPLFLALAERRVLLVGGGAVAAGKLMTLLAARADVVVVAPEVRPEIVATGVRVERRAFRPRDLDDAWLVVSAAPPAVNRRVAAAAAGRRVFVNAVDDPAHASAYTGGVVRKGGVTLAISTAGDAPALAGLLREGLEAALPDDVGLWRRAASRLKRRQRAAGVPMAQRRPQLLAAINRLYRQRGAADAISGSAPRGPGGAVRSGDRPPRPNPSKRDGDQPALDPLRGGGR